MIVLNTHELMLTTRDVAFNQGKKYCLAWPMKNHAAAAQCTNPYIPDTDMRVFVSSVNPTKAHENFLIE